MSQEKIDFIIVGQGMAGSILAHKLIERGKTVRVIDNHNQHSSSQVAAGIINPITGPRLTLSDQFSHYYQNARSYYLALQTTLNAPLSTPLSTPLWTDLEQHRQLTDPQQLKRYQKRLKEDDYQHYLGKTVDCPFFDKQHTTINIKKSAVIDSKTLLSSARTWLTFQQSYSASDLKYEQIEIHHSHFKIDQFSAKSIIFCEGFQAINNPWLAQLPFLLSKGDILTIETDQALPSLLNWGNWLTPTANHSKLGSNYQWDDLTTDTNEHVRQELINSMHKHTTLRAHVIKHESGIRPTTKHRKPFVGPLSTLQNAYCFNGFGSKGCLLIPYHADLLSSHLLDGTPLPIELTQWL